MSVRDSVVLLPQLGEKRDTLHFEPGSYVSVINLGFWAERLGVERFCAQDAAWRWKNAMLRAKKLRKKVKGTYVPTSDLSVSVSELRDLANTSRFREE